MVTVAVTVNIASIVLATGVVTGGLLVLIKSCKGKKEETVQEPEEATDSN